MDLDNNTCSYYKENDYCKRSGDHKGSAWEKEWGELKDFIDTKNQSALVCPECGCKEGNIYDKIQLDFIFMIGKYNQYVIKSYSFFIGLIEVKRPRNASLVGEYKFRLISPYVKKVK